MRNDPLLDTRRYFVRSQAPSGQLVELHDRSWSEAIRWALAMRATGHKAFTIRQERNTPIPDAMLTPCAQPATEGQA